MSLPFTLYSRRQHHGFTLIGVLYVLLSLSVIALIIFSQTSQFFISIYKYSDFYKALINSEKPAIVATHRTLLSLDPNEQTLSRLYNIDDMNAQISTDMLPALTIKTTLSGTEDTYTFLKETRVLPRLSSFIEFDLSNLAQTPYSLSQLKITNQHLSSSIQFNYIQLIPDPTTPVFLNSIGIEDSTYSCSVVNESTYLFTCESILLPAQSSHLLTLNFSSPLSNFYNLYLTLSDQSKAQTNVSF